MEGIAMVFALLLGLGINLVIIRTIVHYSAKIFAEYFVDELERRGKL